MNKLEISKEVVKRLNNINMYRFNSDLSDQMKKQLRDMEEAIFWTWETALAASDELVPYVHYVPIGYEEDGAGVPRFKDHDDTRPNIEKYPRYYFVYQGDDENE